MIGVFDSGLGGLSVWQTLKAKLPEISTIYIADQANAPYGNKDHEFIKSRGIALTEFLLNQGATVIVVACNTATINIPIAFLRENYPQVVFVGVEPPIKLAAIQSNMKEFAVCATKATCESSRLQTLIAEFATDCKVTCLPTIEWANLVEANLPEPATTELIKKYLDSLYNSKVDVIGLGCTHYPFLLPILTKLYGARFEFLDVSEAVAQRVTQVISIKNQYNKKILDRFISTSKNTTPLQQTIANLLNLNTSVESIQT